MLPIRATINTLMQPQIHSRKSLFGLSRTVANVN